MLTRYPLGVLKVFPFTISLGGRLPGRCPPHGSRSCSSFHSSDTGSAFYVAAGAAVLAVSLITNYQYSPAPMAPQRRPKPGRLITCSSSTTRRRQHRRLRCPWDRARRSAGVAVRSMAVDQADTMLVPGWQPGRRSHVRGVRPLRAVGLPVGSTSDREFAAPKDVVQEVFMTLWEPERSIRHGIAALLPRRPGSPAFRRCCPPDARRVRQRRTS